ncbi:MAG TPA: DNA replication and repair protein RecF, partial [Verrucomicrobiales bacterium]|nr:DNA replication and repair protein RecF [Verrucomicrobiales bacterium]
IAPKGESLAVAYAPNVKGDFAEHLRRQREREYRLGSTAAGPHRDELTLELNERPAADFASEGQKRTVAIALKMAQAEHFSAVHGVPPVLLIDDVMGELDATRRAGFIPLLDQCSQGRGQVFMTCTEENWPRELAQSVSHWQVENGGVTRQAAVS